MPVSLPVMFRRDLDQLLDLPIAQLMVAVQQGMPVYGFIILDFRCGKEGALETLTVTRSGMAVEIQQDGRIVPAIIRRKVG